MRSGRQAQYDDPRLWIAPSWHRLGPVFLVPIGPPLLPSDLLSMGDQSGTPRAGHDLAVQDDDRSTESRELVSAFVTNVGAGASYQLIAIFKRPREG